MLKESIKDIPSDKTAKNIKFLRSSVRLSINDLASLIETDPIILTKLETKNYKRNFKEEGILKCLICLANYFAVHLDVLIYTDIEKEKILNILWFNKLIDERCKGEKVNRRKFYKEVDHRFEQLEDGHSIEDVLRNILCNLHESDILMTGKIDFLQEINQQFI